MPPLVGELGTADPNMIGMSLVHLRFCELAAFIHKCCQTGDCTKMVLQWSCITQKLRLPHGDLSKATRGNKWERQVAVVGHARILGTHLRPLWIS